MSQRLRTFIAVEIESFTRDRLVGLQERLAATGAAAKWVEPENLHITLLFLGEVNAREVPDICRVVADGAAAFSPFPMTLAGAGAFPTPRRPRTLIAHVTEGADQLIALHDALEPPLMELGCYRREVRAFKPHLTIGRVRGKTDNAGLSAAIRQFEAWEGGQSHVREVLVLSSQLRAEGPEYTVLSRAPLRGKPDSPARK
jgi:RNA 2',3'-cyclic 3'-phosphodiesterase